MTGSHPTRTESEPSITVALRETTSTYSYTKFVFNETECRPHFSALVICELGLSTKHIYKSTFRLTNVRSDYLTRWCVVSVRSSTFDLRWQLVRHPCSSSSSFLFTIHFAHVLSSNPVLDTRISQQLPTLANAETQHGHVARVPW